MGNSCQGCMQSIQTAARGVTQCNHAKRKKTNINKENVRCSLNSKKNALIQAFGSVSGGVYHWYNSRVKSTWEVTSGQGMVGVVVHMDIRQ